MFKKLSKSFKSAIERHSAGATVLHSGPFSNLVVPEMRNSLSSEIVSTYVNPFYMTNKGEDTYIQAYNQVKQSVTPEIISSLLAEFNWRARSVAADFIAVRELQEFEDQIGKLLLRSDVCYSGNQYCLALAVFSNQKSIDYLNEYLEYYLLKKELYFDQGSAMAALDHIGRGRTQDLLSVHRDNWNLFTEEKDNWNLTEYIERFDREMSQIVALRE